MERRGIDTFIHEIIQIKKRQIIRGKCSICKNSIEKKHGLNAYTFLRGGIEEGDEQDTSSSPIKPIREPRIPGSRLDDSMVISAADGKRSSLGSIISVGES